MAMAWICTHLLIRSEHGSDAFCYDSTSFIFTLSFYLSTFRNYEGCAVSQQYKPSVDCASSVLGDLI